MSIKLRSKRRLVRNGLAFLGLSTFVIGAGGLTAYRHYFRRPGELAANLIPGDALAVITLDTNPAPDQVALYKRMQDAIKEAGLSDQMDNVFGEMSDKSTLLKDVRPYISDNYAVAVYEKAPKDISGILYVAMTDRAKIEELLTKDGTKKAYHSVSYYELTKEKLCVQLRDDYLLIADAPQGFIWADGVRMARQKAVAALPAYQEARASLPADASLIVYVSPKAMRELQDVSASMVSAKDGKKSLSAMPAAPQWMAYSATVRDTGLAFDYRVPMDAAAAPYLKTLAQIAAIRPDALRHLPTGAYSVSTLSQPGQYFNVFRDVFATDKKSKRDLENALVDINKETGMSVTSDLVPAFNGDFTVAVYPDANHADGVMDAVLLADDANGATPAALADKVRVWIAKESGKAKQSEAIRFLPTKRDGATFWYLDAHSQKTLSEMLNGIDPTQKRDREKARKHTTGFDMDHAIVPPEVNPYLSEKTIAFAQVGNALMLATSKAMLNRAVAAYEGHGASLADDPGYADMEKSLTPGSQNYTLVHLGHIMDRLQPELKKSLQGEDAEMTNDIIGMFGSPDAGLAISSKYDGKMVSGSVLLPLNYEKLIKVIGKASKKVTEHHDEKVTRRQIESPAPRLAAK